MRHPAILAWLLLAAAPSLFARDVSDYVDDVKDYALAPLHWDRGDWTLVGEAATATAAAYGVDSRVRRAFAGPPGTPKGDPDSLADNAPAAAMIAGTLAAGVLGGDPRLRTTARDMTEAFLLATGSSQVFKHVFARVRPDGTDRKGAWFASGDSFPSGHAAAAFAAAQVLADSRPPGEWTWRIVAYGVAGYTGYTRLDDRMHWASDIVAGAALGMATGHFVSSRGDRVAGKGNAHIALQPIRGGAALTLWIDPTAWSD